MHKIGEKQKILMLFSFFAIFLGIWLILSPSRQAAESLRVAKQLVLESTIKLEEVDVNSREDLKWYRAEYALSIESILDSCQEKIIQADQKIELAEKSSRAKNKQAHADEVQKLAEAINKDLLLIYDQLAVYAKATDDAQASLSSVSKEIPVAVSAKELAGKRLQSEGSKYLTKYLDINQELFDQISTSLAKIDEAYKIAYDLLPVDGSVDHLGDPIKALSILNSINDNLASVNTGSANIISNFNFYLESNTKAASSVVLAKQKITATTDYLTELVANGPLEPNKALKESFSKVAQATEALFAATTALETLTAEGKYDLPLSYTNSLAALKLADDSIFEAKNQLALLEKSRQELNKLQLVVDELVEYIDSSKSYQNKLNNHDSSIWSTVANNLNLATKKSSDVQVAITELDKLISINQSYQMAIVEAQNNLKFIKEGEKLVSSFRQLAQELEDYRAKWPSIERQADNAIDNEESQINSYGSYDSSAQSDFDSAESYLASARAFARSRDYQSGIEYAQKAILSVDGTGDRAYQTYNDYEDEQARKRRAADDFNDSFSSSGSDSWGGSSSGSDSWGGSSSSSDGGGWGGSSSSSDGGGWGGSSSSSDGGDW